MGTGDDSAYKMRNAGPPGQPRGARCEMQGCTRRPGLGSVGGAARAALQAACRPPRGKEASPRPPKEVQSAADVAMFYTNAISAALSRRCSSASRASAPRSACATETPRRRMQGGAARSSTWLIVRGFAETPVLHANWVMRPGARPNAWIAALETEAATRLPSLTARVCSCGAWPSASARSEPGQEV